MLTLTLPWIWNHPLAKRQRLNAYGRYDDASAAHVSPLRLMQCLG